MLETAPRYDPVLTYLNAIMDPSLRLAMKLLMFWTHTLPLMNPKSTVQIHCKVFLVHFYSSFTLPDVVQSSTAIVANNTKSLLLPRKIVNAPKYTFIQNSIANFQIFI